MECTIRLLWLSLGTSLIFFYVNATNERHPENIFDRYEPLARELQSLREKQAKLEKAVAQPQSYRKRMGLEMDLHIVTQNIARLERAVNVPYKDFARSILQERKHFETEKAKLQRRLVRTESMRIRAIDELALQIQEKSDRIGYYQRKADNLTEERNKVAREYKTFTDSYYGQEQQMKEERDQLLAKQDQLQETIDEAKKRHAQALEAITATPAESYRPYSIPEQDEINKLRISITVFNGSKDRKNLKEGLEKTSKSLEELLDRLYENGKFTKKTSREDLQSAFSEMEKNAILQREEQDNLRKDLLEKMKQKDLTSYSDEELASLQKTNKEVATLDMFLKEIDRRSAYLKGILEVSNLLKECSNAIRDANERNLAKMWTDAIQGAADSPLAKTWAKAVQDAKDSDFAKAWVDVIQNANGNIAKVWTDAIRDIKDSRVAKMWCDSMKNIQTSTFGKFCKSALDEAKNKLSRINSTK